MWIAVETQAYEGDYEHVGPFDTKKATDAFIKEEWGRLYDPALDDNYDKNFYGTQWHAIEVTSIEEYRARKAQQ
jgi:hypothetical protein